MKILLDATGGDAAPGINLEGTIEALLAWNEVEIGLLGPKETLEKAWREASNEKLTQGQAERVTLIDAPEVITPEEHPAMALRKKKNSPFVLGMQMVHNKEADAFVSAGSTGAVMAGAMFVVRCVPGIARPALATILPVPQRPMLLIDAGANVDCKPQWLLQFALMGSVYMNRVCGVEAPEVGLLNIGTEDAKGNALTQETCALFRQGQPFRFAGNIEARDALMGRCDVLVADGFAGNVLLKNTEGVIAFLFSMLKSGLMGSAKGKIAALLARDTFRTLKKSFDSTEVGGAPLLGVDGAVVKAHGSSNGHAIFCALRQAKTMVENCVAEEIREGVGRLNTAAERKEE